MRTGRRTQTFNINRTMPFTSNSVTSFVGRNLEKYQLGGVIFGCKSGTLKECLAKQLFGLPASHFSYVKNIDPGLPIFLFNYSDRKLHGIFEASSKGKMYIDPYAWIDNDSELDKTQYPAQVKFRVRLQCLPLSEDKFGRVIAENYYINNHFWFELDHRQASKLTSLLASLAFASGCSLKWKTVSSSSLPPTLKEGEAIETHEHFTSTSKRTYSTKITSTLDGDIKPLDTKAVVKEVNENEVNYVYEKLKELTLGHLNEDYVNETHDEKNAMCHVENDHIEPKDSEKEESSHSQVELQNTIDQTSLCEEEDNVNTLDEKNTVYAVENDTVKVPIDFEKQESSSAPSEQQNTVDKLMQEVEDLMTFKIIQTQKNCCLDKKLVETELKIQELMDRYILLESTLNQSVN